MNWRALEKLQITPPFKPDESKINFEATHELEEILELSKEDKLRYRRRSMIAMDELSPPMRKMEEQFLDFNTCPTRPTVLREQMNSERESPYRQDGSVSHLKQSHAADRESHRASSHSARHLKHSIGGRSMMAEELMDLSEEQRWKSFEVQQGETRDTESGSDVALADLELMPMTEPASRLSQSLAENTRRGDGDGRDEGYESSEEAETEQAASIGQTAGARRLPRDRKKRDHEYIRRNESSDRQTQF